MLCCLCCVAWQITALAALSPPGTSLSQVLARFEAEAQLDRSTYRMCSLEPQIAIASLLEEVRVWRVDV
jgi:hypothetical protein